MIINTDNLQITHPIRGILLDVRGTILDKKEDHHLSDELAGLITNLLIKGIKVAFISACSMETLEELVLHKLIKSHGPPHLYLKNLVCYINNSCQAYTFDTNSKLIPLSNYTFMDYTLSDRDSIKGAITKIDSEFNLQKSNIKEKVGQFNYYCNASLEKRFDMAKALEEYLSEKNKNHIFILVPTSKDTIDISVSNKSKGVGDFIKRFALSQHEVTFISDSLQDNAADKCVCIDFPQIISIQVNNPGETEIALGRLSSRHS